MTGKNLLKTRPSNFHQDRWGSWVVAVAAAIALNLALFAAVPYLLRGGTEVFTHGEIISNIRVVSLAEEEEVEPEPVEPPEKPEPEKKPEPDRTASLQKPETEMHLPFEINPRLPAGPQSIEIPPMMTSGVSFSDDTFSAGELDRPLTAVSRIPPVYPMTAKRRNIEGWVQVRFVVDEEGKVETVSILDESPPGVFDRAVIDCVSSWRFEPGTIGGIPVRAVAETTIRFELD